MPAEAGPLRLTIVLDHFVAQAAAYSLCAFGI
jgi:hypothetical protein